MSASSSAAFSSLNKGKKEERVKPHATAEDDGMTIGTSGKKSHAWAGANGKRGGTPPPRGNATSNTNTHEMTASIPAPCPSISMLPSHVSPVASSSKITLDPANPWETVAQPPLAPSTCPIPLPESPVRNLPAKGKGKEQPMRTSPPHRRRSIPSSIPASCPLHQTPPVAIADEYLSDTETEVADDSLSTAATEIAPFLPQLPRRLNLPPRRIPTPPLPTVKAIDFAYRPKPSLAGFPEKPIDPKWVVPRMPLPPGCDTIPTLPGIKERWIRQWEAKQDEPGGIYRTGRNRVDGKLNPPPAISAIVTKDGVRGYTSQGWVSPSMKKTGLEQEEDRGREAAKGRQRPPTKRPVVLGHWKARDPEEYVRANGKGRKDANKVSVSVKRSPAPILMQPVPRRQLPQEASLPLAGGPAPTSTDSRVGTVLSPGKKRSYAETELDTDGDDDRMRQKLKDNRKNGNISQPMDVDPVLPIKTNTRVRTKANPHVDAGSSMSSKQKGKANGHLPEEQPVEVASSAPRYTLRSHRNGKGKS